MGTVWRAHDELLGRPVAVKELHVDTGATGGADAAVDTTLREARAVARVHHPHIVCVHDVVEEDGVPFIVMELVEGVSLAERIAVRGPVDAREAAGIGLALLSALRAAHAIGVLHRDLKPANVLVEEATGRVVLTDFGIAQLAGATTLTESGMFVGSPEYTAPERMQGNQTGPAADLWSLGVLLCAVMTGRSPFHRDSLGGVLHAVVEAEIRPPAAAGPLLPVVRGLLERDPARRIDVVEAERLLRAYAAMPPGPALPASGAPDPGPLGPAGSGPTGSGFPDGGLAGAGLPGGGLPGAGDAGPRDAVPPPDPHAPAAHDRPEDGQAQGGGAPGERGDAPQGARSHTVPPARARDRVRHMVRALPNRSSPRGAPEEPPLPPPAPEPPDRGPAAPTLPTPPPPGAEPADAVLPDAVPFDADAQPVPGTPLTPGVPVPPGAPEGAAPSPYGPPADDPGPYGSPADDPGPYRSPADDPGLYGPPLYASPIAVPGPSVDGSPPYGAGPYGPPADAPSPYGPPPHGQADASSGARRAARRGLLARSGRDRRPAPVRRPAAPAAAPLVVALVVAIAVAVTLGVVLFLTTR
ncbi:protein kinase [Streptomyces changanensis]|uniref:non-specific serine/threonine protein kinase n=3 Tax=Streptomyces TaxID=1883 RepID=A0ABY5NFQ4_9ACTN|nr:serine/threonine protein kinase [Streptomyces changanensis]UUS34892.1 protein kinase [Streptomyces changanensis]